jgi:eukaryotic-like serine/threonine-protein kinase
MGERLLQDGQTIGKYYVERFLGEGAFAQVYRVKHAYLRRQAMKIFYAVGMTQDETKTMLEEAALLSKMDHPNIISVYDADVIPTPQGIRGFFTMEYVAGGNLEEFWLSYRSQLVPIEASIDIISQVCRGLTVAHSETPPLIHRDIKPQNILIGYDGTGRRVRLSDFGLAKRVNPLTRLASVRGTRSFKAPEALRNLQGDSCASDVWAVGATLYLLITDRPPFCEAGEFDRVDHLRFQSPLVLPSRLNFRVDDKLDAIVSRALALEPQDRYPSAKEMLDDLSAWKPQRASGAPEKITADYHSNRSKSDLGNRPLNDEAIGAQMAVEAIALATEKGLLKEGADLMEEAFKHSFGLRERYEYRVQAWRSGKVM